jgi:hypothetical protein
MPRPSLTAAGQVDTGATAYKSGGPCAYPVTAGHCDRRTPGWTNRTRVRQRVSTGSQGDPRATLVGRRMARASLHWTGMGWIARNRCDSRNRAIAGPFRSSTRVASRRACSRRFISPGRFLRDWMVSTLLRMVVVCRQSPAGAYRTTVIDDERTKFSPDIFNR